MTGIPTYDPATATFTLPPERADCPTGQGSANLAGSARAHHGTLGDLSVSLASTRILSARALSHNSHRSPRPGRLSSAR